jgi:uncharacterized protein YprB with RNaseH-like and TPR domain
VELSQKLRRLRGAGPGGAGVALAAAPEPPSPAVFTLEPPRVSADPRERVRQARIDHLKGLLADFEARAAARARAEAARRAALPAVVLPGARIETPHGPVRRVDHVLEPAYCHGRAPVQAALTAEVEALARLALDASLAGIDPAGALFIDTETTGLSGGTGTLPFLIGFARFEAESLVVTQLLLESPGEEGPMLEVLRAAVEACSVLVSYNGKTFDWPLLTTRFVLNRVPPPAPKPHLDLLHVARRLFRGRLGSARLVTMEEEILGMRRERDIDGAEIPGVYWSFLRHRDGAQMAQVMEHNANDLVALAALMGVVAQRYATLHAHDDPLDHLALAKVARRAKDPAKAELFARAAAEGGGEADTTVQASLLRAELYKRRGDVALAQRALEDAVAAAGSRGPLAAPAHLALAKLHEHHTKDLARALLHARHTVPAETPGDATRRQARLEQRLARAVAKQARAKAPRGTRAARGARGVQSAQPSLGRME